MAQDEPSMSAKPLHNRLVPCSGCGRWTLSMNYMPVTCSERCAELQAKRDMTRRPGTRVCAICWGDMAGIPLNRHYCDGNDPISGETCAHEYRLRRNRLQVWLGPNEARCDFFVCSYEECGRPFTTEHSDRNLGHKRYCPKTNHRIRQDQLEGRRAREAQRLAKRLICVECGLAYAPTTLRVAPEGHNNFCGKRCTIRWHTRNRRREQREFLIERDGGLCRACGKRCRQDVPGSHRDSLHIDHILPKKFGGTDTLDNLQVLCGDCNRLKGHRRFTSQNSQGRLF